MNVNEYTEIAGERIQDWIEESMSFENGCKREVEEGDCVDEYTFSWMFTQKGQRLYESYLRKTQRLIEKRYPEELYDDLERHTGVIYA